MKTLILIIAAASLAACHKPVAGHHEQPPENGAHFKKDSGLSLTDTMKKAIALKVAEVGDEKVAPSFTVTLSSAANEITGWLTAEQAALVKPGMEVELRGKAPAVVKRIERSPYQSLGDFEVAVETAAPTETGERILATFRAPAGEAVASVPRGALLKTAEGNFVYAVNGEFYVRTPVKVGAVSDEHAEITDGLYAGDQIVTSPVMSLWLAELQILRGGKACTCGH